MTNEREGNVNSGVPPIDYLTGAETEWGWVARPLNEGRESLAGLETHLNWESRTVNLFSKQAWEWRGIHNEQVAKVQQVLN